MQVRGTDGGQTRIRLDTLKHGLELIKSLIIIRQGHAKPLSFPLSLMCLAPFSFLPFFHFLSPTFFHLRNNRRALFLYFFALFTFDPQSLFSTHLFYSPSSCSTHVHLIKFSLLEATRHPTETKQQQTFFAMFPKTALVCVLFAASAQVALAQAVVQPACFMKVFSYESFFTLEYVLV